MAKRIIIAVVLFLVAGSLVVFYVLNKFQMNKEAAQTRTESDFTTEKFVIDQIWERKLVSRQTSENERMIKSYVFIKPRNEDFNLRFSEADAFGSEKNKDNILSQIESGDEITAKILKKQLEDAREDSTFLQLKRFVQGDRREVSIYKLVDKGVTVSEININSFDTVETDFMDGFARTVGIIAVAVGGLVVFTVGYFRRRKNISKQNYEQSRT